MSEKMIFTTKLKQEREYWVNKLSRGLEGHSLSLDYPRSSVYFPKKDSISLALADDLNSGLATLTKGSNFLLYTTLMAALKVCLNWYTTSRLISIGSPPYTEGGRSSVQSNALVIVDEIEESIPFRQLLLRVRETLSEAYARQNYPFLALVQDLALDGIQNKCPLFDVALSLEQIHGQMPEVKTDIHLILRKPFDQITGVINFNPRLFRRERIELFSDHFLAVLHAAVGNPDTPIHGLRFLTEKERHFLIVQANDTAREYPADSCAHELFEACADRVPDAIAVSFNDGHLTYGKLNRKANQLAHYFRQLGVGPEAMVGICVSRSIEMTVGLLAVMKAGAAFVPLDPQYPAQRLNYILQDAASEVVLAQQGLVDGISVYARKLIFPDLDWQQISECDSSNPESATCGKNLAYVIYTSGSTGKPKGVAIEHRSAVALLRWASELFTHDELAGTLASTSICFDLSIFELLVPLSYGGTVIVAENALELASMPATNDVTLVNTVPSAMAELVRTKALGENVRTVNLAGEPLHNDLVQQIYQHTNVNKVFNLYGPSEDTTYSTYALIEKGATRQPSIGRPISNSQVYLLDSKLQPVPVGAPGELYLGGQGLARGYLNRPAMTAEKFLPNPFSHQPGERVYKTGDLARYRLDGELEFIGRVDDQVKIRGFRIELGEIEAVLGRHPSVQGNVVVAREDEPGKKRLAAYVVSRRQPPVPASELRNFLKQKLPEYMVPHAFVMLDALPLTPSGKVDRRHLPKPEAGRDRIDKAFVGPRNMIEGILAGIWSDLLPVDRVGVHDNFFELGGDSILSIQMVVRANQAGLKLMPKHVFSHQTIAELAVASESASMVVAKQEIITGRVPLTPIQRWFFEKRIPDQGHWNMTYLFEMRREVDGLSVEQAVKTLLRHHDALRIRFLPDGSGFRQMMVEPAPAAPFILIDLSAVAESRRAAVMEDLSARLQASLDLSQGPIVRVALFEARPRWPQFLLITIHHLAVDGVSWRILLEDLQTGISQIHHGVPIRLPLKTTSFKEWAESLVVHARSDVLRMELGYWLDENRRAIRPIPSDMPDGVNLEASVRIAPTSIGSDETEALLQEIPKVFHAQINEILMTALAQALRRWTGQRLLLIDVEGHGREEIAADVDISRTVGWFTSIYPVMLKVPDAAPIDVLESVKEQLRRIPNRGIGYGLLRHLSGDRTVEERLKSLPQAQVNFNYLGQFDQILNKGSFFSLSFNRKGPMISPRAARPHLLYVSGGILQGRLHMNFTYSENCHRRETIERVAAYFLEALRDLISQCQSQGRPQYALSDFPLAQLSEDDLDEVLSKMGTVGEGV